MVTHSPADCVTQPKRSEPIRQGPIVRDEESVSKVQEWAGAEKDGMWGKKDTSPKFQAKLEAYQKEKGLEVNGKYDAKTAKAMRADPATKDVAEALDQLQNKGILKQVYRPADKAVDDAAMCKAPAAEKTTIIDKPQRSEAPTAGTHAAPHAPAHRQQPHHGSAQTGRQGTLIDPADNPETAALFERDLKSAVGAARSMCQPGKAVTLDGQALCRIGDLVADTKARAHGPRNAASQAHR